METETFQDWVEKGATAVEALGVIILLAGAIFAAIRVWVQVGRETTRWYELYRLYLGRAILLGLEFLVAADIIRTVSHDPTLLNVSILGLIVLIRTFLSFTLTVELEGHWPWQRHYKTPPKV